MSNLTETVIYEPGIYQLETSDPVLGGPGGISNRQGQQLTNRTAYLKSRADSGDGNLAAHVAAADPHPTYLNSAEGDAKIAAHEALPDPHPAYATDADLTAHVSAADPHPIYLTSAEGDTRVALGAVLAKALSNPGYITLPGGLILQWGERTETSAISGTFSLPIPFPAAFLAVFAHDNRALGSTFEGQVGVYKSGLSSIAWSGFANGAAYSPATWAWFAIGF